MANGSLNFLPTLQTYGRGALDYLQPVINFPGQIYDMTTALPGQIWDMGKDAGRAINQGFQPLMQLPGQALGGIENLVSTNQGAPVPQSIARPNVAPAVAVNDQTSGLRLNSPTDSDQLVQQVAFDQNNNQTPTTAGDKPPPWTGPKGTPTALQTEMTAIQDYLYPGGIGKTDPDAKTLFGMPISDDDINYALIMGGLGMASAKPGQSPIQAMSQGAMGGMQALGQSAKARKKLRDETAAQRLNVLTAATALRKAGQGKSEFERLVAKPESERSPAEKARISYLTTKTPGVTVDASAKPFAKVQADRYDKIIRDGDFGRHLNRGINRFESALNTAAESGERTGPFAAATQSVVAIGNELGFDIAGAMADKGFSNLSQLTGEKLEKARTELGLQLASVLLAGQGQVTENERDEVRRLVGGLGTSMEGNRSAIKGLRDMANDRINRRNAAEEYLNRLDEQGKKPTLRGFDRYYDEEYGAASGLALTDTQMQDLVTKAGGIDKLKVYLGRNPTNTRTRQLYQTLVGPLP
mgnify:CR=1 FL=1